jgi:ubiquinone biosynthesis protein COQ9
MTRQGMSPSETRDRLIEAVRAHVPFDGWSKKALHAAAVDCGIDDDTARLAFPESAASLIEYYSAWGDRRMAAALAGAELDGMSVRRRIAAAVRHRLAQEELHPEAARAALTFLAQPQNARLSLACLYRTVDAMWFAVGDTSTDFNFYSKRALLAGVYGATLLYWLDDDSEGHAESWAFLDRRLEDVMRLGRLRARLRNFMPSPDVIANLAQRGRSGRLWPRS